jgi:putative membrane protein
MKSIFKERVSGLTLVVAHIAMISVFTLSFGMKTARAQGSSPADHKFAAEAASGGMAEVKLGELAQQKAASEKVKEFGQRMVTDHSKAGDELKQVAQQQNLNLPQELSREDQATYDRLSKLSGKQFDEAYARAMVADHQKDVAAFEREASSGKNEELKQFASRTLPTLKEHLKFAHEMSRGTASASME